MKRIGIMTWYSYQNFGTALQAVALNSVVSRLGYEVQTIAYDPESAFLGRRIKLSSRLRHRIKGTYSIDSGERTEAFESFVRSNLCTTRQVSSAYDFQSLNAEFDAFICGSDQIWSPRCFNARYYLDFVAEPGKRIAYAPSFGCESIPDTALKEEIRALLGGFSSIAVREESGASLVEALIGKRPTVVVDPTLLLDSNQWQRFSAPYEPKLKQYCLFYFLGSSKQNLRKAKRIAEARGLTVLSVPVFENQRNKSETLCLNIGPAEFLTLVQNASLICTDSFHGMVFSVLFNREFVPFERFDPASSESQNTRVYSFLNMIDCSGLLLSRIRLKQWQSLIYPAIDYPRVNALIAQRRKESLSYLSDALMKAAGGAF